MTELGQRSDIAPLRAVIGRLAPVIDACRLVAIQASGGTEEQLDAALQVIAQRVSEVLDVGRVSVWLRSTDGLFYSRAGYCAWAELGPAAKGMVAGWPGDKVTAELLRLKRPLLIRNVLSDPRTIRRAMERWDIRDLLGVPLLLGEEVIGFLFIDNGSEPRAYSDDDLAVSEELASLVAISAHRARSNEETAHLLSVVERKQATIDHLSAMQRAFTTVAVEGSGLAGTIDVLAQLVQKPVVLYSQDLEVLTTSGGRRDGTLTRPGPQATEWYRSALTSERGIKDTIVLPPAPALGVAFRQMFTRIVVDGRCCGYVGVVERGARISAGDAKAVQLGALVAALQMRSELLQNVATEEASEDFLRNYLDAQREEPQLKRIATRLGIRVDSSSSCLLGFLYYSDVAPSTRARRRATVQHIEGALGLQSLLTLSEHNYDLVLLPLPSGATSESTRRMIAPVVESMSSKDDNVCVVVSDICDGRARLLDARDELERLCGVLAILGTRGVISAEDVRLLGLALGGGGVKGALDAAQRMLQPIRDLDTPSSGMLFETLRTYLTCGSRIRTTAKLLDVHENTVRYRLQRIRALCGIDVDRIETLSGPLLAIQLLELSGTSQPRTVRN